MADIYSIKTKIEICLASIQQLISSSGFNFQLNNLNGFGFFVILMWSKLKTNRRDEQNRKHVYIQTRSKINFVLL
jgi:hypothetical protein